MNNEKLKKIEAEIVKVKSKIAEFTTRLRELERQKTETENAGIISLVRDMDITPDDLTAFIQAFKDKSNNAVMLPEMPTNGEIIQNDKEDIDENN